jgi:hypothetical protein
MPYLDVTNNLMLTHFDCGSLSLLQLDVTQNIGWSLQLTVLNMQGRIVKILSPSNFTDVSQRTSGLYSLKIASEGIVRTKKFIKN